MATLVFDIETIGTNWDELGETTQTALTKWIAKSTNTTGQATEYVQQVKDGLGLSPLTGTIASLAMWDVERKQGVVYVVVPDDTAATNPQTAAKETEQGYTIRYCNESQLLEDFWDGARSYDIFVSFNGRRFDVPFLLHRSVAWQVKPTVVLAKNQYLKLQTYPYHVDLQDELTFYGAMYRRPSLHLFCQSYGITSPKEHADGSSVVGLVRSGAYLDLATYNAADVVATHELYERWKEYLAPASFIHTITV